MCKLKLIYFLALMVVAACNTNELQDPKLGFELNSEKDQVVKRVGELLESNRMESPKFYPPGAVGYY